MRYLVRAVAAGLSLLFASQGQAAERDVDLELVLAADISRSMDLAEAALQRRGYVLALSHPDVIEAIQGGPLGRIAVTYVEWASQHNQRILVEWTEIFDAASAKAFAEALERAPVTTALWTSISTAIAFATRRFDGNGFRGRRRIIDISGDGPNNNGIYVDYARDRAVAEGITINGLPIVNGRPSPYGYPSLPNLDLYYEDCVIGGPGAFLIVANGFQDFARAIRRKMILEIARIRPPDALFRLAQERQRPPCDAGEQQLRDWFYDY